MNDWTKLSIEYANQQSYLDDLFRVYPTIPEGIRDINETVWKEVELMNKLKQVQLENQRLRTVLTALVVE